MKKILLSACLMFSSLSFYAQKQVYIPRFITNEGMNLNDPNSQWAYSRSKETENVIVFWEAGFGADPSTATGTYKTNVDNLLQVGEKCFANYVDSLKFASRGSSVTDKYKVMIFLLYSSEWAAYGSGQDELVGTLHVNPAAANIDHVLAHELGHCFEYITGCDTPGGYRYGFGANASGGNGFWEQCAQWMAFKTYPEMQFTVGDFGSYLNMTHLHIIHEEPRYFNFFIQDYWCYKHGKGFMGKLWRDARKPEDPIETYKRINAISQLQFNDEIYDHAARMTTFDIPAIKNYGKNSINRKAQTPMTFTNDLFWQIDSAKCIENYGYNTIKLNAPSSASTVKVNFVGLAGASGYKTKNLAQGGWRFGFVALLENGTRVYSEMSSANMSNTTNPNVNLSFNCPDKCVNLWLVVSGAPQTHWKHAWDDDFSNDESWPYKVKFENTNLLGVYSNPIHDETLTYNLVLKPATDYASTPVALNSSRIGEAFAMSPTKIAAALGSTIKYYGVNANGTLNGTSTANAPGHWFTNTGNTVAWGASAYVFSELNIENMLANIGQYPSRGKEGDVYTIKQQLVYTKSATETATVTLIFNIKIQDVVSGIEEENSTLGVEIYPNPVDNTAHLSLDGQWTLRDINGHEVLQGFGDDLNMNELQSGVYFLEINSEDKTLLKKIVKQ